jgi:hypothetical protein
MQLEGKFSEKISALSKQLINALGGQLQAKVEFQPGSHQFLSLQCPL